MVRRSSRKKRRGNIIVLSAILLVGMMGIIALAVDVGILYVSRDQLQRTADAAALAACWELVDYNAPTGSSDSQALESHAQETAHEFAMLNPVLGKDTQLLSSDIEVGYLENPQDPSSPLRFDQIHAPNAVRITARRSAEVNGTTPLFFARVLGQENVALEAEATAALLTNIRGFRTPPRGKPIGILPFALDEETCLQMLAGEGADQWKWDPVNEKAVCCPDGAAEVNLYPQGTGSPGNRGTVDIGSSNNSTRDISRQITGGITAADMAHHGGELVLDDYGKLYLNGDTGISAGVKDELVAVIGQAKVIPIFREVIGNGNNATYTIVDFVGVRILDVRLTGSMSNKRVTIQPATCVAAGTVADPGSSSVGHFIYSPVWLAR